MIDVPEALRRLAAESEPLGTTTVELDRAAGQVLAEAVTADRDFPPADRSAMDGFAVRAADASRPGSRLRVVAELRAGQDPSALELGPGDAVRIMTGAILPPGADSVVMVEQTREDREAGHVILAESVAHGDHVRRRGEELRAGQEILAPGRPLHAAEIAALAAVGHTNVRVYRPPVVHVLATGDEIVEPDRVPAPHQVRNSNARGLLAQLAELGLGASAHYLGIAGDERSTLEASIERGLTTDVLLVTGGVSVGAYDLVGEVLAGAGMRVLFHGVAVRPGKPLLAGRRGGTLVFGLPGNPVSTYTTFAVFVAPMLRRLRGLVRWQNQPLAARLSAPLRARAGRETYHPAVLGLEGGRLRAAAVATAGSGDVLALARANSFLITPATGIEAAAGAELPALAWREFDLRPLAG